MRCSTGLRPPETLPAIRLEDPSVGANKKVASDREWPQVLHYPRNHFAEGLAELARDAQPGSVRGSLVAATELQDVLHNWLATNDQPSAD